MSKKVILSWNRRFALLLSLAILLALNILGSYFFFTIDLTEEKRYTLTPSTRELLQEIPAPIYAEVMLGGSFPAGFKRLQRSTREMLDDFRARNGFIDYTFKDPNTGTPEEIQTLRSELGKQGIFPTNLRIKESGETVEKLIYPYVIFSYAGRSVMVNLLEAEMPGIPPETILNNSISLLEYKFASAIHRLIRTDKPNVVFLKGHGELSPEQTADIRREIRPFYSFSHLELDSVFRINSAVDLLIVARPRGPFSEPDKFKIDQFVMKGGKVLWLIDPLNVSLDSMRGKPAYIPLEYDLNLDDLLFKYGARIQKNLVLDMECSGIPMQVGVAGGSPQYDLFPWFYHPAVIPRSDHPVVKNLNRVQFEFPASVDTIKTRTPVEKTILISSSPYTRLQYPPVQLSFEILRYDPDPDKFDKPAQPLVVLLEGVFPSHFENRVPQAFLDSLESLGEPYRTESLPTAMIVAGDGDLIRNPYNPLTQEAKPLGFNPYDRQQYANRELILNMIEYLLDQRGLLEARSREVRLRMLDKVRVEKEKTAWQVLNLLGPLVLLGLSGLIFNFWRRRRYAIKAVNS
jgi:ABC-2 type transport system permease protein